MQQSAENITGNVTQIQTGDHATIILGDSHQPKEPPYLPPIMPKKFFGREKEVEEITQILQKEKQVAVVGPNGIGKTSISAKVIEQLDGEIIEDGVVSHDFYQSKTTDDFAYSIVRPFVSPDAKIEDPRHALKSVLNSHKPLIYLGGCENAENIRDCFDLLGSCPLLMTSLDIRQARGLSSVKVDSLDDSTSFALFSYHARTDQNSAKRICELLGNLPLALELAGSYLSENPLYSVEEFADLLEAEGLEELHFGDRHKESIPLLLKRTSEKLDERANLVWALLGLHPSLPLSINAISTILNWKNPETIKVLGELNRYSLINIHDSVEYGFDSGKHISCKNRLIHTYARKSLNNLLSEENQKNYADHYLGILANWTLGKGFKNVQHFEELRAFFESSLTVRKQLSGNEHPDVLTGQNHIARLLYACGYYKETEPLFRQVLEDRRRVLGAEHPDTLMSQNNLAELLRTTGNYEAAESLYRQTLEARTNTLGENHPDTLMSLNNLAVLLYVTNRFEETKPLFKQVLEKRREILGAEHRDTLTSLNNLAALFYAEGNYTEAEPLYRQALETSKQVLGAKHPDSLRTLNNLADLLYVTKRYDEAEPMYREALETSQQVLGDKHLDTLTTMNNLAMLLADTACLDEAEKLSQQAVKEATQVLGADHPYTRHFHEVLKEVTEKQNK